jgi:hypothetical protein
MIKVALLGDIAFFGKHCVNNNQEIYDYFKDVKEELSKYDFVIGNLETPFRKKNAKKFGSKSAHIGADFENIALLKYLGVGIVNLSNNHIFDFGTSAFKDTLKILEENEVQYFGVHNKPDLILEKEGNKLYLNGYCCYSTNPIGIQKNGINCFNFLEVKSQLEKNKKQALNSIISVHAGQEHVNYPNYDHLSLARELAKTAPYVYYGHHPHVLQGIESVDGSVIAHSLGNFCFDDVYTALSKDPLIKQTENNKSSIILELQFEDNKLVKHFEIPIYLADKKMEVGNQSIISNLKGYSEYLNTIKAEYIAYRNGLFSNYIIERKKMRNFNWYMKRLRFKSIKMILNSRSNRKKYFENVKRFVK